MNKNRIIQVWTEKEKIEENERKREIKWWFK
jgi:hypothetical protein